MNIKIYMEIHGNIFKIFTECVSVYIQYLTEVSTPLTFLLLFYYLFSCDNTKEMTLWYNVK